MAELIWDIVWYTVLAGIAIYILYRIKYSTDEEELDADEKLIDETEKIVKKHGIDTEEAWGFLARRYFTIKLLDEINEKLKKIEKRLDAIEKKSSK